MHADTSSGAGGAVANHPLASRMAGIAFLSQNVAMGCMWGSFGVLLTTVESKMGVSRELGSLGGPLVTVAVALLAPLVGAWATKMSLRTMMIVGTVLATLGYAMLALTSSIMFNWIAYGALIGPGLCMTGAVLPSTLVTRWYAVNRGKALGVVHMPILVAIVPLVTAFVLKGAGLSTAYIVLAAIMGASLIPMFFIVDYPPTAADPKGDDAKIETALAPSLTVPQLLRSPRYWVLALGFAAMMSSAIVLGVHVVPMGASWGISSTAAASLITIMSLAGMAGTLIFGWLADKLSGRVALTILCLDSAVLWAILLLHPPFPILAVVIGLSGLHSAAMVPVIGMALSEQFGSAGFSRAFGLCNLTSLPFGVIGIPLAAVIFSHTKSYQGALMVHIAFFLIAGLLIAAVARKPRVATMPLTEHPA